ncbi:hypothetical protein [Lactococcus lactis]|uniref:hypothetical protein n=1 Tax=Lactococcus lactis TaxID=1358 RepID=UPI001F57C4F6|nr:hypothetical protein [Lactococcus lactis]
MTLDETEQFTATTYNNMDVNILVIADCNLLISLFTFIVLLIEKIKNDSTM